MTSISSASSSLQQYSPSQLLQNQLQQEINSGQIASTDQTALTSALDSIQTSLQSGGSTSQTSSSQSASTTPPPSADQLQSKISSLIDAQVSAGTLTSSQATELKGVFQQTFGSSSTSGVHGHHGGHHHGAPPADSDGDSDGSSTSASSGTSSTSSTAALGGTTTDSTQQLVDQFLQSLQQSQQTSYGAAGTAGTADISSLLLNITA